jgi:hypothetical protein
MRTMRTIAIAAGLLAVAVPFTGHAAAADCTGEAATLVREEIELPRLDIASPKDRPVLCITLETVIAFAGRLKIHVAHCPDSRYAATATDWATTRADYSKRFAQNRCRRTLPH